MGYDAMAIGPLELELGAATLRQRQGEAAFPMLSANVMWSNGQGYVGDPYAFLQAGPYRIGVIGLTRLPDAELDDFDVLEPEQALAQLVPMVNGQADTVVLLTNLSYRSALELVEGVPGVDLVIAALPRQLPDRAVRSPQMDSLVVTAEQALPKHTGRRVGKLAVTIDSDGSLRNEVWLSTPMGPELVDHPGMDELLDEYQ